MITKVIEGLQVYPDNMLLEILDSRGCYASSEAKEVLQELGFSRDNSYGIIQLAAFNAFDVKEGRKNMRRYPPDSFDPTDALISNFSPASEMLNQEGKSIREIIRYGELEVSSELDFEKNEVQRWNNRLIEVFCEQENIDKWEKIFLPSYLLRNEEVLYEEI